ncbi:hypothetical protein BM221_005463 [Beauveria bassiana]|uniref:F-box domain-containing protein n=1 Tax=Beauveria bassiana TaxID=176275 RepID=A0A2N6NNN0_BEABA|nr:hypothetical protein BM221_005463 [Beauveria bassiana]
MASARAAMCRIEHDPPESATYRTQRICDNTLDDVQLAIRCPLDNVRSSVATSPPRYSTGQLDRLPTEILFQVLLYADIPSLVSVAPIAARRSSSTQYPSTLPSSSIVLTLSAPLSAFRQTHLTAIYSIEP